MFAKFTFFISLLCINLIFAQSGYTASVDGEKIRYDQDFYNHDLKKEASVVNDYIDFYQKFISGTRGASCPMYPSCSNYGLKVFSEKSLVSAFGLLSDRLMRCGHEHHYYNPTLQDNGIRLIDYPAYDTPPDWLKLNHESKIFVYSDKVPDSDELKLIKKLINKQLFSQALIEIFRQEVSNDEFQLEMFVNKLICYYGLKQYEDLIFDYNGLSTNKNNSEMLLLVSRSFVKLGNYNSALSTCEKGLLFAPESIVKDQFILLKGYILANLDQFEHSKKNYHLLSKESVFSQLGTENISILNKYASFKPKSPKLAGYLSIIPGMGYAYSGHKTTGISALLLNGLLAYATYSNIKSENYGMAVLTGVFNLSFYIGNIGGGVKSARRYNKNAKQKVLNSLKFQAID